MLWIGKKIFKLRDKLSAKRKLMADDEEKPFLDHLEDLRKTLTRILLTLVISMIGCFAFQEQIFEIVKRPVDAAQIGVPEKESSPSALRDPHEWPVVGGIAYSTLGLDEAQRKIYLDHAFKDGQEHLRPVVEALLYYRASLSLPKDEQQAYLAAATAANGGLLPIIEDMRKKKVDVTFERGAKHMRMWTSKPGEGFNLSMKLALYAGIVISFPLLLYFLLEFIVPGLHREERRVLWPSLVVGFGLFLSGVLFSYYIVTPEALRFLYNYDLSLGAVADYRMTDYTSFIVQFTLIFGLCFELPVIVYALNKLGILSYALMSRTRSYAVIVILIIAAIITPTSDLINLSLLAVPMLLLYEVSIWIAWFNDRRVKKREEAEEAEEEARRAARRERAAMATPYLENGAPAPDAGEATPHEMDAASAHGHAPETDSYHSHDGHGHDEGHPYHHDPYHGHESPPDDHQHAYHPPYDDPPPFASDASDASDASSHESHGTHPHDGSAAEGHGESAEAAVALAPEPEAAVALVPEPHADTPPHTEGEPAEEAARRQRHDS